MSTHRTITVLFTDLVGSTQLMTSMTSDDAETLRAHHFAVMRGALAVHRGREFKTMGDGFMAVFDCAGDALGCAVTMQRAAHRHEQEANQPIGLRVGISTGDAVCQEGDFFGVPIIEASRLCAAAETRQVLSSPTLSAGCRRTRRADAADAHRLRAWWPRVASRRSIPASVSSCCPPRSRHRPPGACSAAPPKGSAICSRTASATSMN